MAKADLVRDARSRGIELTGDETVEQLKALLETAGESAEDVDKEAAIDDAAAAVADSHQAVVDAQTELAAAQANLEEAKAAHAALTKDSDAVLGEELYVEGDRGSVAKLPMPADWGGIYERRLNRNGVNYEHVSDAPNGVWIYRRM